MTAKIGLLDPATVAGISAGEVIERPASVVKELIENALDAGATRIRIDIEGAGMKLIRVADDGHGIPASEVSMAFSRHATSKLREIVDLQKIGTFGFRGEALAAIAAAGKVEMRTRVPEALEGVKASGGAGEEIDVKPAGGEIGTVVSIRRLFGAMPARLKFLKSPAAETAAIARVVEPYAMTHLEVHFVFTVDGAERLNAAATSNEMERIRSVIGGGDDISLVEFTGKGPGIRVHGFVETPGTVRRRGRQWLHVNRRPVEDRALRHALISSFEGQLPRDTQPWAVVFIDVDPDQVDVNVHPAKSEVRFANAAAAYRALHDGLKSAFGRIGSGGQPSTAGGGAGAPVTPTAPDAGRHAVAALAGTGVSEPLAPWVVEPPAPAAGSVDILGQMYRTYIVARTPDGLLLVDQHTAHEKVIYERLQARDRKQASQGMLLPQTIEFSPSEFALLTENAAILNSLGIEFDSFGGRSIVLRAVPAQDSDRELGGLLRWLIEDLDAAGRAPSVAEIEKRLVSTMACHMAVKSGDPLQKPEMERIVRELLALKDPRTCPHGRPTCVLYEEGDMAKLFRRTWGLGQRECH